MHCLCYEECYCGTPSVRCDSIPTSQISPKGVANNEDERIDTRLRFLGLENDLLPKFDRVYKIVKERPKGLRYLLWELIRILAPMDRNPTLRVLERVPKLLKDVFNIIVDYHSSHFELDPTKQTPPKSPANTLESDSGVYNLLYQAEVSYCLCVIGNSLRYHPTNLPRLASEFPDSKIS